MGIEKRKKVSCHVITYNHINYISKCIDGILMQKTDFDFEIIIGDDMSTDGTREIVERYAADYPDLIRLNLRQKRGAGIPGKENFVSTLEMCTGEYITLCDGDDYWTDPMKLQKQVDFLEKNKDYVIHSGKAQLLENNKIGEVIGDPLSIKTYHLNNFLTGNNLISCTVMFRNCIVLKKDFNKSLFGDWMLYTKLLSHKSNSLAYVTDDLYSVYRIHNGGVMQTVSSQYKSDIAHLSQIISIKRFTDNKYNQKDIKRINDYCLRIFKHYWMHNQYIMASLIILKNFYLINSLSIRKYLNAIRYT